MRLLLGANLSPRLVAALTAAGYDARHVDGIGLLGAADEVIFDRAADDRDVLVSADADFSMLRGGARQRRGVRGLVAALLRAGLAGACRCLSTTCRPSPRT